MDSETAVSGRTRHGHPYGPNPPAWDGPVARCGGVDVCTACRKDRASAQDVAVLQECTALCQDVKRERDELAAELAECVLRADERTTRLRRLADHWRDHPASHRFGVTLDEILDETADRP